MRDVVGDPDREPAPRRRRVELVERRLGHRGGELLGGEAVAAAEDERQLAPALRQRRDHVLEERLAERPGLLGAVEDGDAAHGRRERRDERVGGEGPEEPHCEHADLLAGGGEGVDRLARRADARAHQDEDALGLGMAVVVEEAVACVPCARRARHRALDGGGHGGVEGVRRLAHLEEDVRVLGGAAQHRGVGVQRAVAVRAHERLVEQRADVVLVDPVDRGELVRRAEPVEEVQERDPRLERDGVRDEGEILCLLRRGGDEHAPSRSCAPPSRRSGRRRSRGRASRSRARRRGSRPASARPRS